jgi:hypothetical protein
LNLQNNNFEGGQSIKVYSQNGHLNAAGVGGLDALRSKNGQFVVNAGGGISYGYNILFFRGGGQEGEYNQVLTADYKVTSASAQKAAQFETTANTEYRNLYNQYKNNADKSGNNVWTSSEIAELNALKDKQFIEYNQILNSGDTQLSVRSSELSSILSKATGSTGGGQRDPIINQILGNAFESNPALLGLARERGIATGSDKSVIESQITNFLGSELDRIGSHLKAHPGSSFIYRQDVSNGVYQIISGGSTYNVDPLAGPSVGNLIPVLISHAGVNSNGVYIDQANSRFGKTIGVYINGGHYEGISASLRASRNAAGIKAGIQASAESEVARQLANPNSGNPNGRYQTYQSGYSASSGQVCNRCGQVHQTTTQSYRRSGGTSRAARSYGSR